MKEKILKLRNDGKSYNEISKILNCSKGTISYYCQNIENNKNLININKQKKNINQIKNIIKIDNISEEEIKKIIFLRKTGNNYDEIIKKTNLTLDKIKKICRVNKLNNQSKSQSPLDFEIDEMNKYYFEVKSFKKVSDKFGWCIKTIRKYIIPIGKYSTTEEQHENRKKNISKNVVKWRQDKKIKLVEYKGGCCQNCGYKKSNSALEFHHINPIEKDFTIAGKSYSYERLKKEADKCIMICSNCHIEIHEEIKNIGYSEIVNKILKRV